ncbi:hypothetical protein DFH09DRAFT_1362627 [Mycena vulgaris]|nr:hypothetical protein DFH09DRAFT_1362627 [Mycena vulgaris]
MTESRSPTTSKTMELHKSTHAIQNSAPPPDTRPPHHAAPPPPPRRLPSSTRSAGAYGDRPPSRPLNRTRRAAASADANLPARSSRAHASSHRHPTCATPPAQRLHPAQVISASRCPSTAAFTPRAYVHASPPARRTSTICGSASRDDTTAAVPAHRPRHLRGPAFTPCVPRPSSLLHASLFPPPRIPALLHETPSSYCSTALLPRFPKIVHPRRPLRVRRAQWPWRHLALGAAYPRPSALHPLTSNTP